MHGGIYTAVAGFPDTPCPYNDVPGDANDEALKAKADAFVKGAVQTIMSSRAWTGNSAIFVVADETDFDGTNPADNDYASVAGCCDSPVLPAGDPQISASWPGGVYGGGSAPMIVVSRLRAAARHRRHGVQPLLDAAHHRGGIRAGQARLHQRLRPGPTPLAPHRRTLRPDTALIRSGAAAVHDTADRARRRTYRDQIVTSTFVTWP